ncbi:MAG: GAF domain-containing protein [Blastocatellia bacterium]|nr:GAF domain-containing protein [Blastocatellia bacterium]MBL8193136.1 GAF domain-containing protein [Blastocatellia bacterium]
MSKFNFQGWYEQTLAEKARLEAELSRVSKLSEVLSSLSTTDRTRRLQQTSELSSVFLDKEFEQLSTLNKKIQVLYFLVDTIRSLSAESNLTKRQNLILERAAELVDADQGALFLVDSANNNLKIRVRDQERLETQEFPSNVGLAGYVASSGRTVMVSDTSKNQHFYSEIDEKPVYRVKNMIATPLRDESGNIIAVIEVFNKNTGSFSSEDEYLLQAFAAQAATVLNDKIDDDSSSFTVSKTMLLIMKALASGLDTDNLLQSLMKKTSQVMNADRSTLFLIDFNTRELWSKVAQGTGINEIRFPMELGIAGYVATKGELVNIPEAYDDARFNKDIDIKTGYRTKTILCAPIRNDVGKIIGVLQVLNKTEGTFDDKDERLIGAFTTQVGKVLKSAQFLINLITIMEQMGDNK